MRSLELFGGVGGLAMGISAAGFRHDAFIENDSDACATILTNQKAGIKPVADWPLKAIDVKYFDYQTISPGLDLLAGGPPCQPFSIGGKHQGYEDERNMFPETIRAVRELRPRAFMFENVRGLMRQSFANYFEYIKLQLTYPKITRRLNEDWRTHLARLEEHHSSGPHKGLSYNVLSEVLNAADFGVPQKRERVFIVGFRCDLEIPWSFPVATHSQDALFYTQWVNKEYWERHRVAKKRRPSPDAKLMQRIDQIREKGVPERQPWMTVRDAICNLPEPHHEQASLFLNHKYQPGARSYVGHTGSLLDEPAKTLKAGDHGVPGGENMLALPNGKVRYFTVRESARLQTFPDEICFPQSWTESMRQLGNAVPVLLARKVANSIAEALVTSHNGRNE